MKHAKTNIFDRIAVRQHRDRAAKTMDDHNFLFCEISERLSDRLGNVRKQFDLALDLGCHRGELGRMVDRHNNVRKIVYSDLSYSMVSLSPTPSLVADEEVLPFKDSCFDLITSALTLHWVNDLPGAISQIARCLKPDGLFLAAMFGGNTLAELRRSLFSAEAEISSRVYPRVSQFVNLRDLGDLLLRADLKLPVVDIDRVNVTYPNALALMSELRGMGESNAAHARPHHFTKSSVLRGAQRHYSKDTPSRDSPITAQFDIIYLAAWKSHKGQPLPLAPGTASVSLAEALDTSGAIDRGVGRSFRQNE